MSPSLTINLHPIAGYVYTCSAAEAWVFHKSLTLSAELLRPRSFALLISGFASAADDGRKFDLSRRAAGNTFCSQPHQLFFPRLTLDIPPAKCRVAAQPQVRSPDLQVAHSISLRLVHHFLVTTICSPLLQRAAMYSAGRHWVLECVGV